VIISQQREKGGVPLYYPPTGCGLNVGGRVSCQVMLVCNVSPEAGSVSETLSSLQFASRAGQVELGQAKKVTTPQPFHPHLGEYV
jgi:hypothetical protein